MLRPSPPAAERLPRVAPPLPANVLGCRIDRLDMDQTVERCRELIEGRSYAQHVSINIAKLVALQRNRRLREIVDGCELVSADGQGIVWASRLLGDPLPGRVAGIDLMHRLLALAERYGYRTYILGARRDVLERAVARLRELHPKLVLAGYRDGYFGDAEALAVAAEIRASGAQLVLVAITSPRKEYFLGEFGPGIGAAFAMGVGGAIDVVAGVTRRAPGAMQRAGLEWLYRMVQEPRRLVPRYVATNTRFAVLLARALLAHSIRAASHR